MSDNAVVSREAVYQLANDLWHLIFNLKDSNCIDMDKVAEKIHALANLSPVKQPMTAVKYLKARVHMENWNNAMCNEIACDACPNCDECPYDPDRVPNDMDEVKNPEEAVAIVEAWAREHHKQVNDDR